MTNNPYTKFRRGLSKAVEIFFEALVGVLLLGYAYGFGWEIASTFSSGTAALLWAIPVGAGLLVGFVLSIFLLIFIFVKVYGLVSKTWGGLETRWEREHGRNQDN